MAFSTRTRNIGIALLVAAGFVSGAYFLSSPYSGPNRAEAESTEELLREYAKKDTDQDGLPDWQEALYDSDPQDPHSLDSTLTDGEAVKQGLVKPRFATEEPEIEPVTDEDFSVPAAAAGSLTERFSRAFLERYFEAGQGEVLSQEAQDALVEELIVEFAASATKELSSSYTLVSVRVSGSVPILEYVGAVESAFYQNEVPEGSEDALPLMEALMQNGDSSAKGKLLTLSTAYAGIASDFAAMPVPRELANDHLELMRSFDTLAKLTEAVAHHEEDPVLSLGALGLYAPSWEAAGNAFVHLAEAVLSTSGEPAIGTPGWETVQFAREKESI